MKNLNELSREIYEANKAKGFWDKERNFAEILMLVVSELGEAIEAHRKGRFSHIDEVVDGHEFTPLFSSLVKDTFEDEIADAFIRLLDMCGSAIQEGNDLHGAVLVNISTAAEGFNDTVNVGEALLMITTRVCECNYFRNRIAYPIAQIIAFCDIFKIDLDAHVTAKIRYNSTRPRLHGKKY